MKNINVKIVGVMLVTFFCLNAGAQNNSDKLKVFIDCRVGCDFDFIRTEINIVDFVRDLPSAHAQVLITAQGVGSGGSQYQMKFYGQNGYEDYTNKLVFTTRPNATASEKRKAFLHYLMLGLSPMIAKTSFADEVEIKMKDENADGLPPYESDKHDKWNFWVYRISARGELSADHVYKNNVTSSNFSANRTTNEVKIEFYASGSLRNSTYTYETDTSTTRYKVKNSDYGFYHNLVKSFSPHWSYGYQTNYSNSTFNNIQRRIYFNPAIEYDFFDYKEVNNRFFVIRYGLDVTNNHYYDTTIYEKINETFYGHRFSAALTLNKRWGTFNSGVYYRNYFRDWKLNSMGISAYADVRITGGLSFFVNLNGSVVHNQVSLVKGSATEQEVLTKRRQLASNYNYYTSFGLSFRFGSILNNFVNPRFDGYGGF
jgi:hypothetical protein